MTSLIWSEASRHVFLIKFVISVRLQVLYGSNSWMTHLSAADFREAGLAGPVEVKYIEGAGHHIYSDQAEEFNTILNKLLESQDPGNS